MYNEKSRRFFTLADISWYAKIIQPGDAKVELGFYQGGGFCQSKCILFHEKITLALLYPSDEALETFPCPTFDPK